MPTKVSLVGGTTTEFEYDGLQRRVRKIADAGKTIYAWGLYEKFISEAGVITNRFYIPAGRSTVVVTRQAGKADLVSYVHTDALGSADVLSDANGVVQERRSYDAWGKRRYSTWSQNSAPNTSEYPFSDGFTGQESDDELGLINMKGRIYDARVGRFLQMDPVVPQPFNSQRWNPYSYVLNNPLGYTDPSGFDPPDPSSDPNAGGARNNWYIADSGEVFFSDASIRSTVGGDQAVAGIGNGQAQAATPTPNTPASSIGPPEAPPAPSVEVAPQAAEPPAPPDDGWGNRDEYELMTYGMRYDVDGAIAAHISVWLQRYANTGEGPTARMRSDFFSSGKGEMTQRSAARSAMQGMHAAPEEALDVPLARPTPNGASSPAPTPGAYSVALEVELQPADFGRSRDSHFRIANRALNVERAANAALAALVPAPAKPAQAPAGWTWQHATIEQAAGRPGVLQLVPKVQHTPGSSFWSVLHPLPRGAGGYAEWAMPAGAPDN